MRSLTDQNSPREFDQMLDEVVSASRWLGGTTPGYRADLLRALGDGILAHSADLVEIARDETGLGEERLTGEVRRTAEQFELYADVVAEGSWANVSITAGQPDARPATDDHRRVNVPLGPTLVFAASNFPFAFGVAGTDTASALAAGCAVMAKGHPGHPRLAQRLGEIMADALAVRGVPDAVFTLVGAGSIAAEVLGDSRIAAGAFTGSIAGGTALLNVAQRRAFPIPFYAEMGSVNPVVVTERAWTRRKDEILDGFVGSMSLSNGQLCTSPGLLFVPSGSVGRDELSARVADLPVLPMLTDTVADNFDCGIAALASTPGVTPAGSTEIHAGRDASPMLWLTTTATLVTHPDTLEERFGPSAIVVEFTDDRDVLPVIDSMAGQLTAAVFCEPDDDVATLVESLSRRAGRVLMNAWPTGVAVSWSMHHGGPWPASSAIQFGSVGAEAMLRFLRPVVYQNFPDAALPDAVKATNPWGLPRRVDGVLT